MFYWNNFSCSVDFKLLMNGGLMLDYLVFTSSPSGSHFSLTRTVPPSSVCSPARLGGEGTVSSWGREVPEETECHHGDGVQEPWRRHRIIGSISQHRHGTKLTAALQHDRFSCCLTPAARSASPGKNTQEVMRSTPLAALTAVCLD